MRVLTLVIGLSLLVVQSAAAATIAYTYESRSVAATAGPSGGLANADVKEAPDFAPWSETASTSYSDANGIATATTSQVSVLDVDLGITLSGSLSASADAGFVGVAQSFFVIEFTLAADTPYVSTLSGSADVITFALASATLAYEANSSGNLPAGDYTLQVNHQEASVGGSASGGFSYALFVPEPSTFVLAVFGVLGLGCVARRKKYRWA